MDERSFDFIVDRELRRNIVSSVRFLAVLQAVAQQAEQDYRPEYYRTIIVYAASIVEALLYYAAQSTNAEILIEEYKYAQEISVGGHVQMKEPVGSVLIAAIRVKRPRKTAELTFSELIKFFEQEKFLSSSLANRIKRLHDIRNTFHLAKTRKGRRIQSTPRAAERVNETLLLTARVVQSLLKKEEIGQRIQEADREKSWLTLKAVRRSALEAD